LALNELFKAKNTLSSLLEKYNVAYVRFLGQKKKFKGLKGGAKMAYLFCFILVATAKASFIIRG
jgi:hypothetical protein